MSFLLSNLKAHLVLWAVKQDCGRFSARAAADAHPGLVSRGQVQAMVDRLALDGWLAVPTKAGTAPEVTTDLEKEARVILGLDES